MHDTDAAPHRDQHEEHVDVRPAASDHGTTGSERVDFIDTWYDNGSGRLTVRFVGDLDMQTAPALTAVTDRQLTEHRPAELALDFAGLTFLDSTGLAVLVGYRNDGEQQGFRVVLQDLRPRFLRLLDLAALADHFVIE